jgi:Protein of unknown function (DUF2871).
MYDASLIYLIAGLAAGIFYREMTKFHRLFSAFRPAYAPVNFVNDLFPDPDSYRKTLFFNIQ